VCESKSVETLGEEGPGYNIYHIDLVQSQSGS